MNTCSAFSNNRSSKTCTCGATGCPTSCHTLSPTDYSYSSYYVNWSDVMKTDLPKKKYQCEDLSFMNNESIVPHVFYYRKRHNRRLMFQKSGYLPKRIRKIRKSKHSE